MEAISHQSRNFQFSSVQPPFIVKVVNRLDQLQYALIMHSLTSAEANARRMHEAPEANAIKTGSELASL